MAAFHANRPNHPNMIEPEAGVWIEDSLDSSDKTLPGACDTNWLLLSVQHNRSSCKDLSLHEQSTCAQSTPDKGVPIQDTMVLDDTYPVSSPPLTDKSSTILSNFAESCNNSSVILEDKEFVQHIPAHSISYRSLCILSLYLNPTKITGSDWKGLADYMGFSYLEIENFALRPDPMGEVMNHWKTKKHSTMGALLKMIGDLEREDLLEALKKPLNIDVQNWTKKNHQTCENTESVAGKPVQVAEVSGTNYPNQPICPEMRGITINDHPDGPIETFDAYVCHNPDTDYQFVLDMISAMEKPPYNLRFCTDWRDLVPGGSYATATAELIENRCKRMIVVLSPEFLCSGHCDFQAKFALSLSPGARMKRMVPIMISQCKTPSILRHITMCDYTKEALRAYFWPRLYKSLNLC